MPPGRSGQPLSPFGSGNFVFEMIPLVEMGELLRDHLVRCFINPSEALTQCGCIEPRMFAKELPPTDESETSLILTDEYAVQNGFTRSRDP